MHGEIGVPLAIPLLRIREPRVAHRRAVDGFLLAERQWSERLGEQLDLRHPHRHFARAGPKERAARANHIADVEQIEQRVPFVAELVLLEVELDAAAVVGNMGECGLAVGAPGHDAAGHAHGLALVVHPLWQQRHRICRAMRAVESITERLDTARFERLELLSPSALYEVQVLVRAHAAALPGGVPSCDRYASMNGSMSPSMTRCTSGILSSVRWSFTIVYGWKT